MQILDQSSPTIYLALAGLAFLIALWVSLMVWVLRDIRERTRDFLAPFLALVVVIIFPFVGVLIYLVLRPSETLAQQYERALEEETLLQAIEERPSCPGCSRIVQSDWIICPYCHTYLKKNCVQCEKEIDLEWRVCPYCATPQPDQTLEPESETEETRTPDPEPAESLSQPE